MSAQTKRRTAKQAMVDAWANNALALLPVNAASSQRL
jgi:hypothetical protein